MRRQATGDRERRDEKTTINYDPEYLNNGFPASALSFISCTSSVLRGLSLSETLSAILKRSASPGGMAAVTG